VVHAVLQPSGAHALWPQLTAVPPETQAPAPLQTLAGVNVDPEQVAAAQVVLDPKYSQAPRPSQLPSNPQLVVVAAVQSLLGSKPMVTGAQVPSACPVEAFVQAWQVPVQALSQQTSSREQNPDEHSVPAAHPLPFSLVAWQVPFAVAQ
jgi:hypothetical protein